MLFFLKELFIFLLYELFIGIILIVFIVFLEVTMELLLWSAEEFNEDEDEGRR